MAEPITKIDPGRSTRVLLVNPYLVRERGISLKSEDLLGSPISEHELVLLLEADYEAEGESGDIRGLAGRMFSSLFGENGLLGALSGERGKGAPVELGELYRLYRKPDTAAKVRVVSGEGGEVSVPEWVCQEVDWVSPGAQEAKNRGWRGGGKVYLRIGRAIRKVSRKILGDGPWRTVEDELLSRVHEVAMEALENLSKVRGRPGEATCEDGGREARGTRLSLESGSLEVHIKETRGTPERGGARFIGEWDISGRIIDEFVKRESKISKWLERTPGVGFRSTVDMLLEEAGGGGGTWPSSMSLEVVGNGEGKTAMVVIPYVYRVQSLRSGSKKAVVGVGLKLLIVRALKDVSEHVERVDLSVKEERLRTEGIVGWRESPIREIIKAYRPEVVEAYARRREAPGGPGSGCPVDRGHIPVTFFVGNGGDEKSFGTGYSVGVHETYVYYDRESGREVVLGYQSPSAYVSVTDEGVLLYSSLGGAKGVMGEEWVKTLSDMLRKGKMYGEMEVKMGKEMAPMYVIMGLSTEWAHPVMKEFIEVAKRVAIKVNAKTALVPECAWEKHLPGGEGRKEVIRSVEDSRLAEGLLRTAMSLYVISEYLEGGTQAVQEHNWKYKICENLTYGRFISSLFEYLLTKGQGYVYEKIGKEVSVFVNKRQFVDAGPKDQGRKALSVETVLHLHVPISSGKTWRAAIKTKKRW